MVAEFTLKSAEVKTIKINYDGDSFELPLQGSLSFKEAIMLGTPDGTYAFMKKHIPEEIMDKLKVEEYNKLLDIYRNESEKQSGKTLGES
ncbi:MAG: hypothetical protein IJ860_07935 [Eubacterium sp.]|nr:hypothetical protein [Eubacterium sp.]